MGLGKLFNKVSHGAKKFFSKGGEAQKILGTVSGGLDKVGNIANKVGNIAGKIAQSPIYRSNGGRCIRWISWRSIIR